MAWYPGATRMELQPESDAQPAIRPTQFIVHSIVGPWSPRRTYEYWRDSTSLESHFGLGYEGDLAQYIGTETRADANASANRRPDGTGAVSIETASNTKASDLWTAAQVEQLIRLGVWLHQHHGIPLRICRTADDPGYGYHRLHPEWSAGGTACPGDARVKQFREVVFPEIERRAKGQSAPAPAPAPSSPSAPIPVPQEDPVPRVLFESRAGGPPIPVGEWEELPAALDTAILRGPCTYNATVGLELSGPVAEAGVQLRWVHVDLVSGRRSGGLPIDVLSGATQVVKTGHLPANQYLKIEATAKSPGVRVAHRIVEALHWAA